MQKPNIIFKLLLIVGLLWLTACGDGYQPNGYDSENDATADYLNMSVVSSAIIELDWRKTESPMQLHRRANGTVERIYKGNNNYYQDSGLQNGIMYCYQLKVCKENCVAVSNSVCSETRQWESHGQAPWAPRRLHAGVVFKDKVWIMGGEYFDQEVLTKVYNDVWRFDGTQWSLITAAAPWSARYAHAGIVFKDKIWILGGREDYNRKSDVWASNDGKNWELITVRPPWTARHRHAALVFKDKIWILAGSDESEIDGKNDVWASSDGKNWELVTAAAPWPSSRHHNFLVFQNHIWMLEGGDWWETSETRNVWTSEDGKNWTKDIVQEGSKQVVNAALVFKNRIWLTGGFYDEETASEVWFSTKDGLNQWVRDNPAPWTGRDGHVNLAFQNKIWIFGGIGSYPGNQELNDVWSY